ncbi:MAG: beta-galactosidase GalA [Mucilaginibacter sp.]|uniref:beta-galactosidase GalA n=1 Tax=Mucilaginibacter sp. TaxID=1882438 RepID=UPI0032658915
MVKKIDVLFYFFVSCIGMNAMAQKTSVRKHLNFDAGWKFSLGNAADPAKDFNFGIGNILSKSGETAGTATAVKFNDAGWAPVSLPHDWVVGLPFKYVKNDDIDSHGYKPVGALFPENSIGWYRKSFTVTRADSGGRIALQFDGIYRDSKVWVNGYYIGGHFSGYNGVSFDITDFVHFGQPNIVVVRADATQSEGWFYEGAGIYRHAWLNIYNNVHIKTEGGLYVNSTINGNTSQINIETTVENKAINNSDATVYSYVTDRKGKIVATGKELPLALAINESKTIKEQLTLRDPHLWSLDDPYLYRAVSIVKYGGRVCDSVNVRFGIRTFKFDSDHGFFLNGVPLKVKGVSCHQDHAGVGSALPDHLQYYRIGLLKEMGVNAYRTTHNPPTPELLDACDSLGMVVMDETRLLTSGKEYEQQFRDLILRDRNHASIFMWSIGNEEYVTQRTDIGKRIAQNQILLQQQLDPSRTSTYAANVGNTYHGVNEVIPVRGFNYNLFAIDAYHKEHPGQPVIGTEVASTVTTRSIYVKDTVHAYVPDYDVTYPSWASTAESWWKITVAREWFMGGFAWTGFDYRGEPTPYRWPNINSHFGIMDMCGFPKNVYYYYQSWWTDKDVLHIAPHWNWKGKEGQPIKVWVNTNADNVELFLNGKSLGKKDMERNGHLVWDVNYQPGKLKAIAYKKGKKLVSEVETTEPAYRVILSPSKTTLIADGGDASVVNVSLVDKKGREVPDALNLVHFEINGDAQIIGVGNGDPSSHEADQCLPGKWQRSLFGGKAQIIIKAGSKAGSVVLTATADGLKTATVEIKQVI